MKKTILSLLMLIVFLTSCNSANERRYTSYICASVNDGIGVSTEIDFWNGSYYKKQNITDKTCFVYGKKYTATYSKSIIDKMNSYTTDIYVDKNYIEFGLRSDTGDLAFFNLMNADFFNTEPYLPEVKNPLDVATSLAYEIACEYVDDITKYTKLVDEPITNYKEKDGVTHEITYYIITFAKKVNGYFSSDYISVKVTSKGNLASIKLGDINAFEEAPLEFNTEVMNQSISEKVVDTYKKSKLNVKESSIRDQKIVLTPNKEICMYSQIDIECSDISNTKTTTGLKILTVLEKKG